MRAFSDCLFMAGVGIALWAIAASGVYTFDQNVALSVRLFNSWWVLLALAVFIWMRSNFGDLSGDSFWTPEAIAITIALVAYAIGWSVQVDMFVNDPQWSTSWPIMTIAAFCLYMLKENKKSVGSA